MTTKKDKPQKQETKILEPCFQDSVEVSVGNISIGSINLSAGEISALILEMLQQEDIRKIVGLTKKEKGASIG